MNLLAPVCSHTPCARRTRHPSGRCHDHVSIAVKPGSSAGLPSPVIFDPRKSSFPFTAKDSPAGWKKREDANAIHFERIGPTEIDDDLPTIVVFHRGVTAPLREEWRVDGKLSRTVGPAEMRRFRNGEPHQENYLIDGDFRRAPGEEHLPTRTRYSESGVVKLECWDDAVSRGSQPAEIHYSEDGVLEREVYLENGDISRSDGPAIIDYHPNGVVKSEAHYRKGTFVAVDGPTTVDYDDQGRKVSEDYYRGGIEHRLDGPSRVYYDSETGKVLEREFHYLGTKADDAADFGLMLDEVLRGENDDEFDDDGSFDLRAELAASSYGPLIAEHSAEKLVAGLSEGIITHEGLRTYLEGAPAEWVRSFEEAST